MSIVAQFPPFNYQCVIGLANAIEADISTITRSGIIVDGALHSILIPATALVYNGQRVLITARGLNTGNGGAKTLTFQWNLANFFTATLAAVVTPATYRIELELLRVSNVLVIPTLTLFSGYPSAGASGNITTIGSTTTGTAANNFDSLDNTLNFLVSVPTGGDSVSMNASQAVVI